MHVRAGADLDTVVAQVLDSLVEIAGVCRAGLALVEGAGRRLRFTSSDRDVVVSPGFEVELEWCLIDAYEDVPLTTVVRTGEAVVGGVEMLRDRYPGFSGAQAERGVVAVAALPLALGESTSGGIVLFYDLPQRFGAHQLAALQTTAARTAAEIVVARRAVPAHPRSAGACVCEGEQMVCVEVEPQPVSVALARRFARRQLREWSVDDDVVDTAVLCLSELVTNVVIHAVSRSRIELRRQSGQLSVTVRDSGGARPGAATVESLDPLMVHGRGLQLVEALADAWGSATDDSGTTVWCTFAAPGGPS